MTKTSIEIVFFQYFRVFLRFFANFLRDQARRAAFAGPSKRPFPGLLYSPISDIRIRTANRV